jgi:uncharacterized membrane protein YfcA
MTTTLILILIGTGLAAGFVDAIAGGGGLLALPVVLSLGLPPHVALGSNKLAATMGVFNSTLVYLRKRIIQPKLWLSLMLSALIGGAIGTVTVHFITLDFLAKAIPVLIILIALYMAIPKFSNVVGREYDYKPPISRTIPLGLGVGFYDGIFGPGTGSFYTTFAMILFKLDLLQASAIARLMNFCSNIAALSVFIYYGTINYQIGLLIGVGYMTGSYIGAHTAIKHGAKIIKPLFLLVVIAIAAKLIYTQYI